MIKGSEQNLYKIKSDLAVFGKTIGGEILFSEAYLLRRDITHYGLSTTWRAAL